MHVPTLAINYWPPDCSPRLLQRFAAAQYAVQVVENETYLGLRTHCKHKSRRGAVRGQSGRRKNLIPDQGSRFTHPAQTHVSPREGDLAAVLEPSHNHRSLAIVQGSLTHFEMKRVFVFPICRAAGFTLRNEKKCLPGFQLEKLKVRKHNPFGAARHGRLFFCPSPAP